MLTTYANPILPGFHPDPSICRVGKDYYLATSSFQWFPGVPIYHSRDLIHWRLLGHALDRPRQLPLDGAPSSGGIYAPTLRFHNQRFYMITTNISQGGNLLVTADDPAGPWSDPIWLDLPGIDPSLFFDSDGTVLLQSTGQGQGIVQAPWDLDSGAKLGSLQCIWPGTGGRYPEGPHLYRINNLYYLMIAEGGTEYGHMVTLSRAQNPWGPFESCPRNPILTHRDLHPHPIQGTGHADLVQAEDGSWWMVFLAFRPLAGNYHHLGRETFLAPVVWDDDGWPVVNQNHSIEISMSGPLPPSQPWPIPAPRETFKVKLDPGWNFLRNPKPGCWSLTSRPGCLRLFGLADDLDAVASPALVAKRQQDFDVAVSTELDFHPDSENEEAGLSVFMDERHHAEIFITRCQGERVAGFRHRIGSLHGLIRTVQITPGPAILKVEAQSALVQFKVCSSQGREETLGVAEAKYFSSEVAGGFTGVYLGLYATGHGQPCSAPADFLWFDYQPRVI